MRSSSTHAAEVQLFNIKFKAGPSIGHIGSEYKKTLSAPPQAAKIIGIHLLTPREHAGTLETTTTPPHHHSTPLHSTPLHTTPHHSTPPHTTPHHTTPPHTTPHHQPMTTTLG
jgi:hypothetical protein